MVLFIIFALIAGIAIFAAGLLFSLSFSIGGGKGSVVKLVAGGLLVLGLTVVFSAGLGAINEARSEAIKEAKLFEGYVSITPEPAIYRVIFVHELNKKKILVGTHIVGLSYKRARVFQLERELFANKKIPPTPEYLAVSEGDEGQLVLLLR